VTGETLQIAKSPSRSYKNALKSAHFVLSDVPQATKVNLLVSSKVPAFNSSSKLLMAVPKRLLKRAVDRNAVKRICREAWMMDRRSSLSALSTSSSGLLKPKLLKLVNLPKFSSIKQLKSLMRVDIEVLLLKMHKN
jgi:ribonuclease P protein component